MVPALWSRRWWVLVVAFATFVIISLMVRGAALGNWAPINPDEAELMAQARAALLSPAPFSTWTLGTTGPFWVLFLAGLGAVGYPLTLASAHLLSALLVAFIGFVVWVLLVRSFGMRAGVMIGTLWWLPFALVYPVGDPTDFGALSTELFPCLLVLVSFLFPTEWLVKRPWLFIVVGLLDGAAVGAKYQILPLAVGVFAVQVLLVRPRWSGIVRACALWVRGMLLPSVAIALVMVASHTVSLQLLEQNFSFLGSYAGGVSLSDRFTTTTRLLDHEPYLYAAAVGIGWLTWLSSGPVRIARAIMLAMGLTAVYAGGKALGHYLIILIVAVGIALALPIRDGRTLIPRPMRAAAVVLSGLLVIALVVVGIVSGVLVITSPNALVATLSPSSVIRQPALAKKCPVASRVLVWGWAPELYVDYSWRNTVPFMNTLGIATDPSNRTTSAALVKDAIASSDCVIDAVGDPFFGVGPQFSIALVYPQLAPELASRFRVVRNVIACDSCTVYVRK